MSPEQKIKIVEDSETCLQTDESGTFVGDEDVSLNEVYSSSLSVPVSSLFLFLCFTCAHTHTLTHLVVGKIWAYHIQGSSYHGGCLMFVSRN